LTFPRLRDAGDAMLLLEFEPVVDPAVNARAIGTAAEVRARALAGVREVRATLRSVAVEYDPRVIGREEVGDALLGAAATGVTVPPSREIRIPVVYGGEHGPDLAEVAARSTLSETEVIAEHANQPYLVFMLGFSPGFPYLGLVSDRIVAPRRATPRLRVPAGSVGVAGRQTGIYPRTSPGGWALVGRTNLRLFDPEREPAALVQPGDRVRFVPVDRLDFADEGAARPGARSPEPGAQRVVTSLTVIAPGLLTTVQDAGRPGWQASGVPVGGALDRASLARANRSVGNDAGAAVLEATLAGLELRADRSCVMAIAGADLGAALDGRAIPLGVGIQVPAGAIIRLTERRLGARAYLAFGGGVDVPVTLGSRSTDIAAGFGGFNGRPLRAGDRLAIGEPVAPLPWRVPGSAAPRGPNPGGGARLRVLPGPHDARLSSEAMATLTRTRFQITPQSNRMGYRLHGATPIAHRDHGEMISDATVDGGIQVPPDGQPILLMADRQVTGGYPILATVITADLPLAAQLAPGDQVEFVPCTRETALAALRQEERA
jgi:KipI family sensor histidine kinase inhibitor